MSTTCNRFVSSRTIGFSVSIGKVVMASTLFFTSSATRRPSAPRSSSIVTVPIPSFAVERICLMPSMPSIASSMRTVTADSTSSGAAPRYGTSTLIRSSSISGNTSSLALVAASSPLATMNTIIRLAATPLRANHSIMPCTLAPPLRRRPRAQAAGKSAGPGLRSARRALRLRASRAGPFAQRGLQETPARGEGAPSAPGGRESGGPLGRKASRLRRSRLCATVPVFMVATLVPFRGPSAARCGLSRLCSRSRFTLTHAPDRAVDVRCGSA